jgi:hypothetical protein
MQYTGIACIVLPFYIYTAAWNPTLTPRAMLITDRKLSSLIHTSLVQGCSTGFDLHFALLHIGDKGIQQSCAIHPELLASGAEFFNHINNMQSVIDRRTEALHRVIEQHNLTVRYTAWQQYQMAALIQMNRLLKEQIPALYTNDSELYVVYMGAPVLTLDIDQQRSIYRHVVTYALLLSYIESHDTQLFKEKFCVFPYYSSRSHKNCITL